MSKSIISFLTFVVLVLIIFITSSIFSNLGRVDPLVNPYPYDSTESTSTSSAASSTTLKSPENTSSKNNPTSPQGNTTININVTSPAVSGISMSEVQKHNLKTSCWTVVGGGVYDLTSFITPHPGGAEAILSLCGVDGTSAFLDQHGNQRRPNNELAGLKIGDLSK